MSARAELRDAEHRFRRFRRRLKTVLIRQAARKAFDLPRFGTGPLERITVSLILAGAFGFVALGFSHLVPMATSGRLAVAGAGFLTVLLTSAVLVLWTADDERLAAEKASLKEQIEAAEDERVLLTGEVARQDEEDDRRAAREEEWRRREPPREKRCPYCREYVLARAVQCKHCGEILDEELAESRSRRREPARRWNPGVAAVLSFLIPGLGQMYKGQVLSGLLWFLVMAALYTAASLGIFCCFSGLVLLPFIFILQVICIFDAASGE
jgi:TM2 domain-containing membrane protein YozV